MVDHDVFIVLNLDSLLIYFRFLLNANIWSFIYFLRISLEEGII